MNAHILRHEGKHYKQDDLEFWAEDGLIFIEDHKDGEFIVETCENFALRAKALNREAKRAKYQIDRDSLNDWVLKMYEAWREAKSQGDPADAEIAKQKYKERRKAIMVTGMW